MLAFSAVNVLILLDFPRTAMYLFKVSDKGKPRKNVRRKGAGSRQSDQGRPIRTSRTAVEQALVVRLLFRFGDVDHERRKEE